MLLLIQGNEIESIAKSCQCKILYVCICTNITSFLKTFNRRSSSHCKYWHTSETLFWLKGTTGSPTIDDFWAISFRYLKGNNIHVCHKNSKHVSLFGQCIDLKVLLQTAIRTMQKFCTNKNCHLLCLNFHSNDEKNSSGSHLLWLALTAISKIIETSR